MVILSAVLVAFSSPSGSLLFHCASFGYHYVLRHGKMRDMNAQNANIILLQHLPASVKTHEEGIENQKVNHI